MKGLMIGKYLTSAEEALNASQNALLVTGPEVGIMYANLETKKILFKLGNDNNGDPVNITIGDTSGGGTTQQGEGQSQFTDIVVASGANGVITMATNPTSIINALIAQGFTKAKMVVGFDIYATGVGNVDGDIKIGTPNLQSNGLGVLTIGGNYLTPAATPQTPFTSKIAGVYTSVINLATYTGDDYDKINVTHNLGVSTTFGGYTNTVLIEGFN